MALYYTSVHQMVTLAGGIANSLPNSSKVILLYNLLAERMLCSITARSSILEPILLLEIHGETINNNIWETT